LLHLTLVGATIAVVAWGALAFGSVYVWAYRPLAAAAVVVGLLTLIAGRAGRPPLRWIALSLLLVGGTIALQLVPLPVTIIEKVSPATDRLLRQYDLAYAVSRGDAPETEPSLAPMRHPLSVAPTHTLLGLGLFASFSILLLGTAKLVSVTSADTFARPLVVFGVALAIIGIAQHGMTAHQVHPLIYGFWKPRFESRPFGPFVNPNHFAGWMLMVLPIALGLFYDRLLRAFSWVSGRDNRIDIINAPGFPGLLLFGFASVLMGVSLVMTRSRSALGAFAAASMIAAWLVLRRLESPRARVVAMAAFLVLFGGAASWAGMDAVLSKFTESTAGISSVGGRIGAWQDTGRIIGDFFLTGSGFNTYGIAMLMYERSRDLHFNEAHNEYLQIMAEGGLLVGIPVALALFALARAVRHRFREAPKEGTTYWIRVGAVIGLIGIGLQSLVEFSLQMPGNSALFAVVAALALHQSPSLRTRDARDSGAQRRTS